MSTKILISDPEFCALGEYFKKICSEHIIMPFNNDEIIVIIYTFGGEIKAPKGFRIIGVSPDINNVLSIRLRKEYLDTEDQDCWAEFDQRMKPVTE